MAQTHTPLADAHRGNNGKRPPGRPRSEQSRQAILGSTLKLLRQRGGFSDLSIEAIAADANVSKATVYRWWPTKAALVADAFSASADLELQFPDTGSVCSGRNSASFTFKPDRRKSPAHCCWQALQPFSPEGIRAVRFQQLGQANAIRSQTSEIGRGSC